MKVCKIAFLDYSLIFSKILKDFLSALLICKNYENFTIFNNNDEFKKHLKNKDFQIYFMSDILFNEDCLDIIKWLENEIEIENFPLIIITINEANSEKLKDFLNYNNVHRDKILLLFKPISIHRLYNLLKYIKIDGQKIENLIEEKELKKLDFFNLCK